MVNVFLVGLGGCLGSIMRYLMVNEVNRHVPNFPFGTLAVNVLGCFVIAFIGGLATGRLVLTEEIRLFVFVGILGGFTTFSAFGYETFYFIKMSQFHLAFLNVMAQVILGLSAVALGYVTAKIFV